jgi:NADP-dependent 3-hydroxy acid dehydrogenase YdfG
MELKDQVAIITGASSGIGAAVARNLDAAGMKLVLTARRADRLEALCASLQQAVYLPGDIADPVLPRQLLEKALTAFGHCEVVINNAGVIQKGTIETIDVEKVCAMVRVNVEAVFRMAYTALKHFRAVGRGHLVNTSSVVGTKVRPEVGAYAGTKFAIEAFSETLRMELARTDIQVSCIEPGLVMTELHHDWEVHPKDRSNIRDPLQPEDIARCIRFVLEQPPHVRIPRMLVLPRDQNI